MKALSLLIVGAILLLAAAAKGRSLERFSTYLQPLFGSHAGAVARLTVGVELGVGALVVLAPLQDALLSVAPLAAVGVLYIGTAVISVRFRYAVDTRCSCFGDAPSGGTSASRTPIEQMMRPLGYSLRNAALVGCACVGAGLRIEDVAILAGVVPALLLAGLAVDILLRRRSLDGLPVSVVHYPLRDGPSE